MSIAQSAIRCAQRSSADSIVTTRPCTRRSMETHGNHRRMVSKWSIPTRNGCGNDTCWKNKAPPDGSAPKSDSKYLSMRAAAPALSDLPQLHELIQDSVQAAEYRQLVDLLRYLLQRLQFLQTHKDRVVLDQLGRVERRTGRVRLFTAADDVGLRRLLRLHHAVGDLLHLAGQDHVLDADTQYFDAQFTNANAHVGKDIAVQLEPHQGIEPCISSLPRTCPAIWA